jgi:septal ring factor EnvC (AmiA/AmiB activator)
MMMHRRQVVPFLVLAAFLFVLAAGCAGTRSGSDVPDDPVLIRKELVEIERDMQNTEEMIKGSKAQLQMDDSQELRDEIRSLEMSLIHLESQKRALEERLTELEATEKP